MIKIPTKKLVILSMLAAMSFIVMWFGIPILPMAPYLKFEPSDVPLLIATLMYGPFAGMMTLITKNLLYFIIHGGNPFGIISSFIASTTFLLVTAFFHKRLNLVISTGFAVFALALVMIPLNLIVVPLQFGTPLKNVWALLLPLYIPFNLIKGFLNATILIFVWTLIKKRALSFARSSN